MDAKNHGVKKRNDFPRAQHGTAQRILFCLLVDISVFLPFSLRVCKYDVFFYIHFWIIKDGCCFRVGRHIDLELDNTRL